MQFQKIVKNLKVLVMSTLFAKVSSFRQKQYLFSNQDYQGFVKYFWVLFQSLLAKAQH